METLLIRIQRKYLPYCLVRFQYKVMLFVSNTLLLLVNAVTLRRVIKFFKWGASFTLVYYGALWFDKLNIILLSTVIAMYKGLFQSTFKTHSFFSISIYNKSYNVNYYILPQTFKKKTKKQKTKKNQWEQWEIKCLLSF